MPPFKTLTVHINLSIVSVRWYKVRLIGIFEPLADPGRTCTIVNDLLRRTTEIYRDCARLPYTTRAHGVIQWETDSVYGDRTKMLSD